MRVVPRRKLYIERMLGINLPSFSLLFRGLAELLAGFFAGVLLSLLFSFLLLY